MVFNKLVGSLILFVFLITTSSCVQTHKKDLTFIDRIEPNLCEFVLFLDSVDFVGNIGFESQTMDLKFGLANNKKISIPEKYLAVLRNYFPGGVIRGIVNNKQYTYFIVDGFFRAGNYGVIFSKADFFDKSDDVSYCSLLRKSHCMKGNWFIVETKL